VRTLLARNPIGRLPVPVLGIVLKRLFLALDFLHSECQLIHTGIDHFGRGLYTLVLFQLTNPVLDIKADNIMFGIKDDTVFEEFEEEELRNPCPRKEVEGRWIYTSRELRRPKRYGPPVLCDFGSTVSGEKERLGDVQPDIYRSPEVILQAPWQYKIDIWNAGCLVSVAWILQAMPEAKLSCNRSGTFLKAGIYSTEGTPSISTGVGRTLPR